MVKTAFAYIFLILLIGSIEAYAQVQMSIPSGIYFATSDDGSTDLYMDSNIVFNPSPPYHKVWVYSYLKNQAPDPNVIKYEIEFYQKESNELFPYVAIKYKEGTRESYSKTGIKEHYKKALLEKAYLKLEELLDSDYPVTPQKNTIDPGPMQLILPYITNGMYISESEESDKEHYLDSTIIYNSEYDRYTLMINMYRKNGSDSNDLAPVDMGKYLFEFYKGRKYTNAFISLLFKNGIINESYSRPVMYDIGKNSLTEKIYLKLQELINSNYPFIYK